MCSSCACFFVNSANNDADEERIGGMYRAAGASKTEHGVTPGTSAKCAPTRENENAGVGEEKNAAICVTICQSDGAKVSKRIRGMDGYRQRAAALCIRRAVDDEDALEILLVSGRGGKNYWVLPGGGVEKEESVEEAVIREFREEAGIRGAVIAQIGEFTDDERYNRTALFMLSVIEIFDEWEDFQTGRERRWMSVAEALEKIKKSQTTMVEQCLGAAADLLDKIK